MKNIFEVTKNKNVKTLAIDEKNFIGRVCLDKDTINVIFSVNPDGTEHLSLSVISRKPTEKEISFVKNLFFWEDENTVLKSGFLPHLVHLMRKPALI